MDKQSVASDFWLDQNSAKKIMSKLDSLKQTVNTWKNLNSQIVSLEELSVLLENDSDENLKKELDENLIN